LSSQRAIPAPEVDHVYSCAVAQTPLGTFRFGYFVTVAVRDALLSDPHPAAVQRHLELILHDLDLLGSTRGQ
jgi:hypothetical protein